MSGAQATLADRTPSNILNEEPVERQPRIERPPVALKHDYDSTGLVQRCVIIQRDENGFGLTVSGDNPVFVQLVKEDGAAMRAGVQTGDRIIKVNGTLVTQSNHIEVVKLIKSGSYVALTVLGRPLGVPQVPLEEEQLGLCSSPSGGDRTQGPQSPPPQIQINCVSEGEPADREGQAMGTETEEMKSSSGASVPLMHPHIIGAEDDYFEQEQMKSQCSCFQSVDLLKARPAHLAVFLHHVVSQFDPAPMLCFLFAELQNQTSAKESRRFFLEFHSLFLDRAANLKVPVPEVVASELEKRRVELLPEDVCKNFTKLIQNSLLSELQRLLEDFRQKRSMGLTLAEDELSRLELDQTKDQSQDQREQQVLEMECCCAEGILSKIDDILMTSQPSEEDKSSSMQLVIQTYMKHLGVKVKEVKGLEHKRARINFLPKIPNKKKMMKAEKEGEEKVKKRFHNILATPRRLSRVESTSGKDLKQRSPKVLLQPSFPIPEQTDAPNIQSLNPNFHPLSPSGPSPSHGPSPGHMDTSGHDDECNVSPVSSDPRLCEGHLSADPLDDPFSPALPFDLSPTNAEQLQEEDQDMFSGRTELDVLSDDDQGGEMEVEESAPTWQSAVGKEVLTTLTSREVERQEVINELFFTERSHVRKLKVLDCVFYQRMSRDCILPSEDLRSIFSNLQEIIHLHVILSEHMATLRRRSEGPVLGPIGDHLLAWFSEEEELRMKQEVALFCSNLPTALELIRTRQKKDQRFANFMQEAESNHLCRRLQLKDIIPVEMQRQTKYPLLLDNIAKYTDDLEERRKVKRASDSCKKIVKHINQAVKDAEDTQRLREYQRRLDLSSLKQSENPTVLEAKNLDLTQRKLVHEGPLSWKLAKDKAIDMFSLLLEDVLVLLQKQDERLVLKLHGKSPSAESKQTFSPVIRLSSVLVRPVATDHRSFFVLSMSDNVAQIYELTAPTVSDQRTWQRLITQSAESMKARLRSRDSVFSQSDVEQKATEIIPLELNQSKNSMMPDGDIQDSDVPGEESTLHPQLDEVKSDSQEEEVEEAELEAFFDGQLVEHCDHETREENICSHLPMSRSKAQDALHTLSMLKQLLLNHMARETFGTAQETTQQEEQTGHPQLKERHPHIHDRHHCPEERPAEASPEYPEEPESLEESVELWDQSPEKEALHNGGFVDVCCPNNGSTEDHMGIDMTKLLSSSSLTSGTGPNLSRQLMTHLRLLQQDLHYLKEVEVRYRQLQQILSDTTDDDHCTDAVI